MYFTCQKIHILIGLLLYFSPNISMVAKRKGHIFPDLSLILQRGGMSRIKLSGVLVLCSGQAQLPVHDQNSYLRSPTDDK